MPTPTVSAVSWGISFLITLTALWAFGRGLLHLWRQFSSGTPEPGRTTPVFRRLWSVIWTILSHREFRGRPLVRIAHWFVMVSFVVLFLTLISAYAHLRDPLWRLPLLGSFAPWNWLVSLLAWAGLIGISALMVVRRAEGSGSLAEAEASAESPRRRGRADQLASRFLGSTRWQAIFVEWVVWIVCACIIILQFLDVALHRRLETGGTTTGLANAIVLVSLLKIVVSMTWLIVISIQTSMGIAWHRFLAFVTIFTRRNADGSKSLGSAAPMVINGHPVTKPEDFDDIPEDTRLGVATAEDWSWRDRLDFATCTECGRCQELCPAWNTGKPLSPKLLVLALRDHQQSVSRMELKELEVTEAEITPAAAEKLQNDGALLIEKGLEPTPHSFDVLQALSSSGASGPYGVADTATDLVPHVVSEEALWNCTMCGACVDQCPVDIEHIDHVLDLRRHQVLMAGAFPKELGRPFRGMESKANPYNQPARKRMEWAKSLDFKVPEIGIDVEDATEVDWLFWVGCAGAFDDKGKTTSAAIAELLHTAGVSFAVLGQQESCTGDSARRAGNEPLFQMLAAAAIETLNDAKVHNIVVSCAHCFNTIAGEFPELGGRFNVVHHTQLLARLVREGLLTPIAPEHDEGQTVTYHDPCFLGRHNRIFEAPRELINSLPGIDVVEMPRNRERAMCCGAGGAHAWFEESRGTRIADARMVEATETGADIVATACPFCTQMLGSATGSSAGLTLESAPTSSETTAKVDEAMPEVRDVAVMLRDAVRRGHRDTHSEASQE